MGSGSVSDDSARLLVVGLGAAGALSATGVGQFLMVVIAVLASLLFLGLLLLKLVLSISTVLVFVAMPAAVVLWPIPACAWLARLCARAFAVCLLVPACWALCFAATAAVGVDALGFKGSGSGVLDQLLEPLVAIMLLFVTLALPRSLARVAMLGGSALGGGTVSRAVSYADRAHARDRRRDSTCRARPAATRGASGSGQRRGSARAAAVAAGAITVATGGAAAPAAAAGARPRPAARQPPPAAAQQRRARCERRRRGGEPGASGWLRRRGRRQRRRSPAPPRARRALAAAPRRAPASARYTPPRAPSGARWRNERAAVAELPRP